ncbi:MAG: glycerol-3-phosphate 1-O-acyltransferase PlsY [Deltaproteobacteria bacterium]|nr:glycerol-3-phosphate 1-O-acyltransferase PlsY [Deltaproteobacteria bacterium]
MTSAVLLCLGAYVLGSFPTGLLVARARGIDIRKVGSGNIGATNVARGLGKGWALMVLVCDALKGFLPVFIARQYPLRFSATVVALAGLAAIVGHMFTVFLRGRGGKGVATSLGVAIGLSPALALLCCAVYGLAYATTRLSSVGSLLGIWAFPAAALIYGGVPPEFIALSIATALLVTLRHRDNIRRLARGEEKRA